jgi:hypothetical protein
MKDADKEERILRQYLLGELDEDEQEYIEERFITDRDFKERTLITEDELVEDYLSGELSEVEKKLFLGHFLSTPEQLRKLRIASSLKKYLNTEMPMHPTKPGGEVRPPGIRESAIRNKPFWRNPMIFVPVSLTLLFAVIFGLVWLVGVQQRRKQLAELRLEVEQLNNQAVSNSSRGIFLTPLNARGDRDANILPAPANGTVAQLWLMLIKDEYPSYQVIFQKDGNAEQFPVSGLRTEVTPRGKAIPLRIPAEILNPGTYILKLNGITDGERIEEVSEYNFRVAR